MASRFFDGSFASQKIKARPRTSGGACDETARSDGRGFGRDSTVMPGFKVAGFATCMTFRSYQPRERRRERDRRRRGAFQFDKARLRRVECHRPGPGVLVPIDVERVARRTALLDLNF